MPSDELLFMIFSETAVDTCIIVSYQNFSATMKNSPLFIYRLICDQSGCKLNCMNWKTVFFVLYSIRAINFKFDRHFYNLPNKVYFLEKAESAAVFR